MQKTTHFVVPLFALLSLSTVATGTSVYKCGTTFSQFPCPDGQAIKTNDVRSGEQKAQSDRAIVRDKKLADNMEKNRSKQERIDIAANTPPAATRANLSPSKDVSAQTGNKKAKKPDWFIAQVPGEKKKPPTSK